MTMSRRAKIYIAVGSLVGLALLMIVVHQATRFTAGLKQNCPKGIRQCSETNQLHHLESQQCFEKGQSHGRICGNNMVISPLLTCKIQGVCECDYKHNERHLVYDDQTDQCYPIYSQGPCENGYVLTISSNSSKLKCRRDICMDEKSKVSSTERDSIVPYKNKCYALSSELEEPGCTGQLKFWKGQLYPSCSPAATGKTGHISWFTSSGCEPGSVKAFNGQCRPSQAFTIERPSDDSEED